ncbi:O-antigen ligase family protein [Patescibacteria group bacterium]
MIKQYKKNMLGYYWFVFFGLSMSIILGFLIGTERYFIACALIGFFALTLVFIKLLENPFWGILGITFFLPFERLPSLEIGGNTVKISYVLIILTLLAWLIKGLVERRLTLKFNPAFIILGLFLLVSFVSMSNTPNIVRSFTVLSLIILMAIAMFLFINLVDTKQKLQLVVKTLFISAITVLAYGFLQSIGDIVGLVPEVTGISARYSQSILGFPRFQSTALEPLYFANYLFIPLGLLIGMIAGNIGTQKSKSYQVILLFVCILALFLTVSRGGYLGFLVIILVFLLIRFRKVFTSRIISIFFKTSIALVLASILFFSITSLGNKAFLEIKNHLSLFSQKGSISERLGSYNEAIDLWRDHPVIGNGIASFGPLVADHSYEQPEGGWPIVNNEYLEILTEQGLLGLIIFIGFLIYISSLAYWVYRFSEDRYLKYISLGLFLAFIGIVIQYSLFSTLYIIHLWALLALIIICYKLSVEKRT